MRRCSLRTARSAQPAALHTDGLRPMGGHVVDPTRVTQLADQATGLISPDAICGAPSEPLVIRPDDPRSLGRSVTSDRRRDYRWSALEVPWVSAVRLTAGESGELINVSSGGALVRTLTRPPMSSLTPPDLETGSPLDIAFELTSGQQVRVASQVVRCSVASMGNGPMRYAVALRFDGAVGLDLPPAPRDECPPVLRAMFDAPVRLQNELLARLGVRGSLPSGVREAISDLIHVNTALVRVAYTLREAHSIRPADPELRDLIRHVTPLVKNLKALRSELVERISANWNGVLVTAYAT